MKNKRKPANAIQRSRVGAVVPGENDNRSKNTVTRYPVGRCMASLLRAATGTWCFLGCADGWLLQLLVLGAAVLVAP